MVSSRTLTNIVESEDQGLRKLLSLTAELSFEIVNKVPHALGSTEGVNIYGEKQTEIDVWANELLVTKLLKSGLVKHVASEELDTVKSAPKGEFSVVLDPLDGSSNLKSNNLVGTIIGVYHDLELPAKGRNLQAALYYLYGPYLECVLALQSGAYTLVGAASGKGGNRFIGSGEPYKLPGKGTVYGIGGARDKWVAKVKMFVDQLESQKMKMRYGGSFVGDYNQVFHNGGFFAYPELTDAPNGKYRLQFESNPVGYITIKAGGKASTGKMNILDVEPTAIDQRVATYVGNTDLVTEFEKLRESVIEAS